MTFHTLQTLQAPLQSKWWSCCREVVSGHGISILAPKQPTLKETGGSCVGRGVEILNLDVCCSTFFSYTMISKCRNKQNYITNRSTGEKFESHPFCYWWIIEQFLGLLCETGRAVTNHIMRSVTACKNQCKDPLSKECPSGLQILECFRLVPKIWNQHCTLAGSPTQRIAQGTTLCC